ncbi:unnamed protein product [Leuciscus chuanchicus]
MLDGTYNLPRERKWIQKRDIWLSDTIQNEVIQQYACAIQREIVSRAINSPYYGLTADGTTDSSTIEQFSLMLHDLYESMFGYDEMDLLGAVICQLFSLFY